MINFCQPDVGSPELSAVREVFASAWLGSGPRASEFERRFALHIGRPAQEVLAVSSCTEGLFQAVIALDLGPGDDVVLPTISFVGAAHAVRSSGARVVLCDVDPHTLNPSVRTVEDALTPATKAVLILHYGGDPGVTPDLADLARRTSAFLVEDAACSVGSSVHGRACGTFGDVGVWSFDAMKTVTTGDGGMVWCKDPLVADRVRASVRMGVGSSGLERSAGGARWWEVDPVSIGRRATLNDVAAAIGIVQLGRLPGFLERRRAIARAYDEQLRGSLPWLRVPAPRPAEAAWFYYPIQSAPEIRDRLASYLLERDIYTNFRYWPLHRMTMYRTGGSFPGADRAAAETLLLPVHPSLSDNDVERVVSAIRAFVP